MSAPIDRAALEEAIRGATDDATLASHIDCRIVIGIGVRDMLVAVARAHLETLPEIENVEVWHVEYSHYGKPNLLVVSEGENVAREKAQQIVKDGCKCVVLKGPFQHAVSA